jgi:hypothetical protein
MAISRLFNWFMDWSLTSWWTDQWQLGRKAKYLQKQLR